jgi:cell wall assembly regulator SMI1
MNELATSPRILAAYEALLASMRAHVPEFLHALRPPVEAAVSWAERPGAEQVLALWSQTSGEIRGAFGALGGLTLLGPIESEAERHLWDEFLDPADGIDAIADLGWDISTSAHPTKVHGVYYAAGWIPLLAEPYEANYLAVDLVPLDEGQPGQVILCGRDEDEKCVVAPDLASLLELLAEDCASGAWELRTEHTKRGDTRFVRHRHGRLLNLLRERATQTR